MAVIVRMIEGGARFVLLGGGFGAFKTRTPHLFFGDWSPSETAGEVQAALVCDFKGTTFWVKSAQIEVVSVDGKSPSEILDGDG